jgi:O-antigen ligase
MDKFEPKKAKKEAMSAIFIIVFVSISILANFFVGFNLLLFALMMLLGAIIAMAYPRSGVLAIVFLTFIFERFFTLQSIFIGRSEYKLYPLDIILGAVILGTLFQIMIQKIKPRFKKIDWYLIAFIFFNIVYFFFSIFILKSDTALAFSTFKNYAFYSLLYFLIIVLFPTKEYFQNLFRFAFAGAVGILFFIGFGIVNGYGLWSEYTPLSTEGVRLLAFTHGFYLSLVSLGLLIHLIFSKEKGKLWQYALLIIWTFGIVGSMMRHLWIAIIAVLVMLYLIVPKEQKKKLASLTVQGSLVMLLLGVLFFYSALMFPQSSMSKLFYSVQNVLTQRVGSLVGAPASADESFSWRTVVWKEALNDYATEPFLGIGFGKMLFIEIDKYREMVEVRNIHNSPLILVVQMGLIGLLTLGILLFSQTKKLWQKTKNDWLDYFLLISWVFYLIVFLFQPYLEANLLGIFFWILLGLIRVKNYESFRNQ